MYKILYDKAISEERCTECFNFKEEKDKHYSICFRCRLKRARYEREKRNRLKATLRLPFLKDI